MLNENERKAYYQLGTSLDSEEIGSTIKRLNDDGQQGRKNEAVWYILQGIVRTRVNSARKIAALDSVRAETKDGLLSVYLNMPNPKSRQGDRLLDEAISSVDNELLLNILHEQGIDIRYKNSEGSSPLFNAIANNCSFEVITALYPSPLYLEQKNQRDDTPYSIAIEVGNQAVIDWMSEIKKNQPSVGANSNALNPNPARKLKDIQPSTPKEDKGNAPKKGGNGGCSLS
ncbi:MAG: hypothetical protein HKM04_10485 [Legionellales bacterium]|nr:hypothetical protein [Legionellales bacterium]